MNTAAGPVQFGMPPETVKDHMTMGCEVPTHYILPTNRFHKRLGINVAEFEFPAYFNFFLRKKQINLICTKEAEEAIRIVFQETLIGPKEHPVKKTLIYISYSSSLQTSSIILMTNQPSLISLKKDLILLLIL